MKTIKKLSLAVAIMVATIFSSCSKTDPTPAPATTATPNGLITCKINGVAFTTAPIAGQAVPLVSATRVGAGGLNLITITGQSAANITASAAGAAGSFDTITISLSGVTAPGTYQVNSDNTLSYIYSLPNPSGPIAISTGYVSGDCSGTLGTIKVTSLTATQIEGTFMFTAKKENTCDVLKTITEGNFSAKFLN